MHNQRNFIHISIHLSLTKFFALSRITIFSQDLIPAGDIVSLKSTHIKALTRTTQSLHEVLIHWTRGSLLHNWAQAIRKQFSKILLIIYQFFLATCDLVPHNHWPFWIYCLKLDWESMFQSWFSAEVLFCTFGFKMSQLNTATLSQLAPKSSFLVSTIPSPAGHNESWSASLTSLQLSGKVTLLTHYDPNIQREQLFSFHSRMSICISKQNRVTACIHTGNSRSVSVTQN